MKAFDYYLPTKILYGAGRVEEVGKAIKSYGDKCLVVTGSVSITMTDIFAKVETALKEEGIELFHFDGVTPNPTTEAVDAGVEMAKEKGVDVILGVGGGSSMDTAKAIAVGATHPGTAWEYRIFTDKEITAATLPIVVVSTTSGTGSQTTPVSVVTNTAEKCKYALVDNLLFPRVGIVDPELMETLPPHATASTGFDAFTHAFESYIHKSATPFTDMCAYEALRLIVQYLPRAIQDGGDKEARANLAWADTLAGACIANSGVVLPHSIAMAIGGHAPHVRHGEALSVVYPEFFQYTHSSSIKKFAAIGRLLDDSLAESSDEQAAEKSCESMEQFLKSIGMYFTLKSLNIPEDELAGIADDSVKLPDYTVNPRVPDRDKIFDMLKMAYDR
ncbi:MAG: iron-containing alcohol dehydrogenase [Desulfobacterales bacterium]|nr:MAG: iron-containing alcohol dehydrogenase [Desulfobacterales bacterium]